MNISDNRRDAYSTKYLEHSKVIRIYVMEKSISSLPLVLKRRWLPALVTFAAVIGASVAYLTFTPRLYQASTRLMLDDRRVSLSDLGRDLSSSTDGYTRRP